MTAPFDTWVMAHGLYEKIATPTLYEKQAGVLGGLAHALGMAGAGHVSTNAAGLAAHHASNVGEVLAHRGLQHGLGGQRLTPVMKQSIKSIFGPESLINYEAAHGLAQRLLAESPHPDDRLKNMLALVEHGIAHGTPVARPMQQALEHHLRGSAPHAGGLGPASDAYAKILDRLTSRPLHGMETGAQRLAKNLRDAVPAALFVGADAALSGGVPTGAAGHALWNGARQAAGHTDIGQKLLAQEVVKGLEGAHLGKAETLAYDLGASPAFLDARRVAARAAGHAPEVDGAAAAARRMGGVDADRVRQAREAVNSARTARSDAHGVAGLGGVERAAAAAEAHLRGGIAAARPPSEMLRERLRTDRAGVTREVERHLEKTLGEPKLRLLPHIKVEPTGVPAPNARPQVRAAF